VELEKGEALFEVAKRPGWPFVVRVGRKQITALGTAFIVRRDSQDEFAVTLVEGKIAVTAVPESGVSELQPGFGADTPFTLMPGQRLTFASARPPTLDRPGLDKVTAWQRGHVSLDNTSLADAVAEMNRYSPIRLVIEDPKIAAIQVSGVFRAGDSVNFAQAVAKTHQLEIVDRRSEIILTLHRTERSH